MCLSKVVEARDLHGARCAKAKQGNWSHEEKSLCTCVDCLQHVLNKRYTRDGHIRRAIVFQAILLLVWYLVIAEYRYIETRRFHVLIFSPDTIAV